MQDKKDIDLTIAGNCLVGDGIGSHLPMVIRALHDKLKINTALFPPNNFQGLSKEILDIVSKPFDGISWGKVAFWVAILGIRDNIMDIHKAIKSPVKYALSVFESNQIPPLWTNILNSYYDAVIVPDPYLVNVYKSSGVRIPIFVLPLIVQLEKLLARPLKTKANDPFTFGMSGGFWKRKGHEKILAAFGSKFGNDPRFKLRLHGRFGAYKDTVLKAIREANFSNVEIFSSPLHTEEYENFLDSLDCYVFPSGGEGFSITPREALALGKPCILSNNSAHLTINESGATIPLKSETKVPAHYEIFGNKQIGFYDDCSVDDLATLMVEVVSNYDQYLEKAKGGREWVSKYLLPELKPTYLNLLKPTEIVFGDKNVVDKKKLMTSDKKLYSKLRSVFK
jgi:glycosyltransferase involved in cell wall biosynthesis